MPELAGWFAWMKREPRGDRRRDVNFAVLTAYLRQCWIEGKEDPSTFLVRFDEDDVIDDPEVEQLVDEFLQPSAMIGFGG